MFARELLGIEAAVSRWARSEPDALITTLGDAGDARAQMINLGLVLGAFETTFGVHTWRNPKAAARRYLTQIAAWGYELSQIEQSVIHESDSVGD